MINAALKIFSLVIGLGIKRYVYFFPLASPYSPTFPHIITTQDIIAEDQESHGSTFVPLIIGSDKTTVSVATGHTEYHPLYLSVGNIFNSVRRAHRNGVVLVGFLAIPKCESIH